MKQVTANENESVVSKSYMTLAGIGALAFWMGSYLRNYFGAYFITDILMLPASTYAVAMTIQSLMGFFIAPTIGIIVDNGKQGRFGKYRKWLLLGPILYSICFALCFLPASSNPAVMTVYLTIIWSLTTVGRSFVIIPYYTLHATIARTPGERTGFVSKRNFWVNVGKLIYSATYLAIIGFFATHLGSDVMGYTGAAIFYAVLNVIFFTFEFFFMGNPEAKLQKQQEEPAVQKKTSAQKGPSIMDIIKNIGTNAPFGLVCIDQMGFSFNATIRNTMYVYYYNSILGNAELYALHLTLASIMGILATLALPQIAKFLENKKIAAYSFTIQVFSFIGMRIFMLNTPVAAMVFAMIGEFCAITNGSIVASMFQDSAVYAEWKTGVNSMATIVGASQIVGTVAGLICPTLLAAALDGSGYVAGQTVSTEVATKLVNIMCFLPMAICAISAVAAFLNPLNNQKLNQYQQEIAQRNQAKL